MLYERYEGLADERRLLPMWLLAHRPAGSLA